MIFESAVEGERWNGLHFRNANEQVLRGLKVVGASTGLKLENSGEVEITESEFIDNSVAIEVFSSDGIRYRQNKITNSVISNNGTGISARSTGVIIDGNHIGDTLGTAINLSGGTCGGGSRCGWASEIKNNLIENSTLGVNVFGHNIKILKNDIYNVNTGMTFNLLTTFSTGYEDIKENNIRGWRHTALQNLDADNLDIGINWIEDSEEQYAICDTRENISYGMINYVLAENPFSKSHEYQLPIIEDTNSNELGSCILDSYNYIDSDQHWGPSTNITSSQFISSGATIFVDAGSTIKVSPEVELIFGGVLEVVGDGYVIFESAVEGERWNGLHFRNANEQVLRGLKVVGASTGLKLENSGEVEITESEFIDNSVAIEVFSSDGIRYRQNKITNSVISNNGTGISARSTGVIIDGNHIGDTLGTAINLSGGTCGGGSRCGWASEIKNNLIENSTLGVNVFGHNIKILKNDIYNVNTGMTFNLLTTFSTGYEDIKENNIRGWRHTALQNLDADNLDIGINWIEDSEEQYAICDTRENISYGMINYVLAENPFSKSHEYQLPIIEDTNSNELGSCILDSDNDTVGDNADAFPNDPNETLDSDNDTVGDNEDNCPADANTNQSDIDNDTIGDVCDSTSNGDSDLDTIDNLADNCPAVANTDQLEY